VTATPIGLVLLALCLRYAGNSTRLVQLVLVAGVFEAAAAFILGGFGLQPGLLPAAMLVALVAGQYLMGWRSIAEGAVLHLMAPLLLMFAYAAVTAFLLPDTFAGRIIVWPQKFDGPAPEPVPLGPGQGNVNQVLYLTANVAVACAAALALGRAGTAWRALVRAYLLGGYLVVGIAAWELGKRTVGIPFPTEILQSNPGWVIVEQSLGALPRLQGPFSEPSSLGFYLVGVVFACAGLCLRGHAILRADILFVLAVVAVFLSTSTTGIAALVLGLPAMLAVAALRGRGAQIGLLVRRLALPGVAFLLLATGLLVLRPELLGHIGDVVEATLGKAETSSFEERTAMNGAAWTAFLESGGLGIGWGSTRASSVLPGILAGSGLVGAVAVAWFALRLIRAARFARAHAPAGHAACIALDAFAAALAGQLLAAVLSAPMITTPIFFVQIGIVAAATIRLTIVAGAARRAPVPHAPAPPRAAAPPLSAR
jgi:hypothetical protein